MRRSKRIQREFVAAKKISSSSGRFLPPLDLGPASPVEPPRSSAEPMLTLFSYQASDLPAVP